MFFENPTLPALAEAILLEQLAATNDLDLEQALHEIKNLSEDELKELLAKNPVEEGANNIQ